MAPLDRALALAQVNDIAVRVAEDLHLDMPRRGHGLLQVDRAVAERSLRLAARQPQRRLQLVGPVDEADALAAAARRGLQQDWVADALGDTRRLARIL